MEEFALEGTEFIELKNLLKVINWVASGAEAKKVIEDSLVQVDGQIENRKACKIRAGHVVSFEKQSVKVTP